MTLSWDEVIDKVAAKKKEMFEAYETLERYLLDQKNLGIRLSADLIRRIALDTHMIVYDTEVFL